MQESLDGGEDGIFGVSDNKQLICMNLAMWNGKDCRLKERLFGLTGHQGNHGEDVKELYYYLDNTPTHSYMKALYKYPFQKAFPYDELVQGNAQRGYNDKELEIYEMDGYFQENNGEDTPYFDVEFEMAKDETNENDLNFRIVVHNRSKKHSGQLHLMPQVFFRNTWAWDQNLGKKPSLYQDGKFNNSINITHEKYGTHDMIFQPSPDPIDPTKTIEPILLFTDNEPNFKKLFNSDKNPAPYCKDAFEEYIVHQNVQETVNPKHEGTKACAVYYFPNIPPGESAIIRYKFTTESSIIFNDNNLNQRLLDEDKFDSIFINRKQEADNFYWRINPQPVGKELRNVQRQAFAGLLWTKQFYNLTFDSWFNGDPSIKPTPPPNRANGRNANWKHLYIEDILSMPDKWEYPFFASWDSAFHCIALAMVDPEFAKRQLDLLTREWYMHPNGQIPVYEWNFNDVNPPVHAWAVYRVYKIEMELYHREDRVFLERVFQKLLLNFTWWVNRKDTNGKNLFEGGFLGLDNIGIFNRSEPLPTGGTLEQADSTGWMAFFSLQMLNIALELAKTNPVYEDIASKFFEHFILISDNMSFEHAIDTSAGELKKIVKESLWNEEDKFYYDAISWGGPNRQQLPIRSLVGLIPIYASMDLETTLVRRFPGFKKRVDWFINNKPEIFGRNIASISNRETCQIGERALLSLVTKDRLAAILTRMLDENEFLSDYGIRSLSKFHEENPFRMNVHGKEYCVKYLPGESDSGMFGGNSNWRGPIWFPTSFLMVESLQRLFTYYGPDFKVECPVGSSNYLNLEEVAELIRCRMIRLFLHDKKSDDKLPIYTGNKIEFLSKDPYFKDLVTFYEYFDGDTGRGLGATHQLGWTSLVAKFINDIHLDFSVSFEQEKETIVKSSTLCESTGLKKSAKSFIDVKATEVEVKDELTGKPIDETCTVYTGGSLDHDYETDLIERLKTQIKF